MGGRASADLDDLARAVADGVPRRVVVGRIAAFMAAFLVGDPELALGAKKRCPKGRRRCGSTCCKPGYVCRTHKHKKRCVCPKPHKACDGRCVNTKTDERNCGHCGHRCASDETCVAGTCTPPSPTCADGVRNGNETDIDCGGPSCPKCADGKGCATATDCVSGVCTAGVCVAPPPACSADVCGAQHGCPPCANGHACAGGADCASGHCAGGVCVQCATAGDCAATTAAACHAVACVSGTCGQVVDDSNAPAAPSDCTSATCSGGTPVFSPAPPDTPCSAGFCDGSGNCTGCVSAGDCGTDTTCTSYTCSSGTCGMVFAGPGTPAGSPTCASSTTQSNPICDGNGNVVQSPQSCSPYLCASNTCQTTCASPVDCAAGYTCLNSTCVPRQCTTSSQCTVANGTGTCNQGICEIGACNPGYADCDSQFSTGCETSVNNSVQNCGTCGHACGPVTNATSICANGTCTYTCNQGFLDCDGNPANGCEFMGTTCP
jgi:hypothetical protein